MNQDIRWKQRFDNYSKALNELKESRELAENRPLSKLEKQGVIQGFEYTHELAWNLIKDYLEFQGHVGLIGSRDTTREAFKRKIITNGELWMEMIQSRNLTSHAYDRAIAERIYAAIFPRFYPEFAELYQYFLARMTEEQ
ncbi:nucleotidyltransferase substrate binding protein [Chromatium okenii]|jgi:nucleotidyltransferase substrate binding protein (TIGR01987 family)|uniref:Nucleotidyltransferase n=1 Tax=Chromatium okenii TaxID=61644 RepID=A0A2S7XNJ3_9GAMM|nr:nucleotidyltransferase substrate binding protein [Chromatium okenii]PQJ94951.1 nucleotidyltransferase [Chromatium okenii]